MKSHSHSSAANHDGALRIADGKVRAVVVEAAREQVRRLPAGRESFPSARPRLHLIVLSGVRTFCMGGVRGGPAARSVKGEPAGKRGNATGLVRRIVRRGHNAASSAHSNLWRRCVPILHRRAAMLFETSHQPQFAPRPTRQRCATRANISFADKGMFASRDFRRNR